MRKGNNNIERNGRVKLDSCFKNFKFELSLEQITTSQDTVHRNKHDLSILTDTDLRSIIVLYSLTRIQKDIQLPSFLQKFLQSCWHEITQIQHKSLYLLLRRNRFLNSAFTKLKLGVQFNDGALCPGNIRLCKINDKRRSFQITKKLRE